MTHPSSFARLLRRCAYFCSFFLTPFIVFIFAPQNCCFSIFLGMQHAPPFVGRPPAALHHSFSGMPHASSQPTFAAYRFFSAAFYCYYFLSTQYCCFSNFHACNTHHHFCLTAVPLPAMAYLGRQEFFCHAAQAALVFFLPPFFIVFIFCLTELFDVSHLFQACHLRHRHHLSDCRQQSCCAG